MCRERELEWEGKKNKINLEWGEKNEGKKLLSKGQIGKLFNIILIK